MQVQRRLISGDAAALASLLLLALLMLVWPLFSGGDFIYGHDIGYFYGHEVVIRHSLDQGDLPLWDPYFEGGSPHLGKIQTGLLYPFSVVFRSFLPITTMFNVDLVIHVFLAGLGVYVLLRDLGIRSMASTLSAIMFMGSGSIVPRVSAGAVSVIHVVTWTGWLLLAYRRSLLEPRWRHLLLTVVFTILVFQGGHPQMSLLVVMIPGSYFLFHYMPGRSARHEWRAIGKALVNTGVIALLAGGLLAIQLLPFAEWTMLTSRGVGEAVSTSDQMIDNSLFLQHLLTLVMPFIWFEPHTQTDLLMGGLSAFWEVSPFLSLTGLVLLLIAFWSDEDRWRGLNGYLFGLALFALFMSMGQINPFYRWASKSFPYMRAPGRFLLLYTFPLALLSGIYLDKIFEPARQVHWQRSFAKPARIAAAFLILCALLGVVWLVMGADILSQLVGIGRLSDEESALLFLTIPRSLLLLTITCGLITALLWMRVQGGVDVHRWQWYVLSAVLSETLLFAMAQATLVPEKLFYDPSQPMAQLDLSASKHRFDYFRYPPYYLLPTLGHVYNDEEYFAFKALSDAGSKGTLLLSAGFKATQEPITDPDYVLRQQKGSNYLYEHVDNLPRIYAAPSVRIVDSHEKALAALFDEPFEPFEEALVTILPEEKSNTRGFTLSSEWTGKPQFSGSYSVYESDRIIAEVSTDRPVMVVFSEMYYPGWQAKVDGQEASIWRTNYAFRGVVVEAGQHQIEMEFKPLSFTIGLSVSLFSLATVLFASAWIGVRSRLR